MADSEDIQPLVCDNGTGMVKVLHQIRKIIHGKIKEQTFLLNATVFRLKDINLMSCLLMKICIRLGLREMMPQGPCFLALLVARVTLVSWWEWAKRMHMLGTKLSPNVVS